MAMRRNRTAFIGAVALLAQGCYTGLHEMPEGGAGLTNDGAVDDGPDEDEGDSGAEDDDPVAAQCRPPLARIWKLTATQYDASLHQVLPQAEPAGLADEPRAHRWFTNEDEGGDMQVKIVAEMFRHTEAQAQRVIDDPGLLAPCLTGGSIDDQACLRDAMADLVTRAYRRPGTDEEIAELVEYVHDRAAIDGPHEALGLAVHAVLSSPAFLYRTELGSADDDAELVELDAYETAAALSYFLLDGPPDALLRASAAREIPRASSTRSAWGSRPSSAERRTR